MRYSVPVLIILVLMLIISGSVAPGNKVLHRSIDEYNFVLGVIPEDVEVEYKVQVHQLRVPQLLLMTVDYGPGDCYAFARRLGMEDPSITKGDESMEAVEGNARLKMYKHIPKLTYVDEELSYFDGPFKDEDFYVRIAADYLALAMEFYPWISEYDIEVKVKYGVAHLVGPMGEQVAGVSVSFELRWNGMLIYPGLGVSLTNSGKLKRMYLLVWDFVSSGYLMVDEVFLESLGGRYFITFRGNGFTTIEGYGMKKMVVQKISIVQDTYPPGDCSEYDSVLAFPFLRLQGEAQLMNGQWAYMDILVPIAYEL